MTLTCKHALRVLLTILGTKWVLINKNAKLYSKQEITTIYNY